ncbi:histidine phosphatase family protein [Phenylobacterium sp.]|uniref:histidine phosphatase family protein n=1 Tax=Phenylobacterium sp. TaxID=1871053 RepID=UPI0035B48281
MGDQAHRPPRRLILVKHGHPDIRPDAPPGTWTLSDEGRAAVAALAGRLGRFAPTGLASSEEPKAVESASIIGKALGLEPRRDAGLGEQRNEQGGFLERQLFEGLVARMFDHPDELVLGEETGAAARDRFAQALDRQMAMTPGGGLVIVSHGRVICLWAAKTLGLDAMSLWRQLDLATALVIEEDAETFEIVG